MGLFDPYVLCNYNHFGVLSFRFNYLLVRHKIFRRRIWRSGAAFFLFLTAYQTTVKNFERNAEHMTHISQTNHCKRDSDEGVQDRNQASHRGLGCNVSIS